MNGPLVNHVQRPRVRLYCADQTDHVTPAPRRESRTDGNPAAANLRLYDPDDGTERDLPPAPY